LGIAGGANLLGWDGSPTDDVDPLGLACSTKKTGNEGERLARRYLEGQGYDVLGSIQNRSGHGIDLVARDQNGNLMFFEVKTGAGDRAPGLSEAQAKGADSFVRSRLASAAAGKGAWGAVHDPNAQASALALQAELGSSPAQGEVLFITQGNGSIVEKPWV
jgi:Holliday junction resolvase-like predicted endonuclease